MTAIEKAKKAVELLAAAGIKAKLVERTDGSARVSFRVFQGRAERDAEFEFGDSVISGSKYTYCLPDNLDSAIEAL